MIIQSAKHLISNSDVKKLPGGDFPEYAFIGRSNVGKSSLINMLCNQTKLARISATPGKTRLINHFEINASWYLVDLPGYGYAKIPKSVRAKLDELIHEYILQRTNMVCLFVLIDSRLEPQEIDLAFIQWLGEKAVPFSLIFTKSDKLTRRKLDKNVELFRQEMLKHWETMPPYFVTSSEKRTGRDELLNFIEVTNRSIKSN
jgi:GTP-binding protein